MECMDARARPDACWTQWELYRALLRRVEDGLNDLQREGNPEVTARPHCPDFFGCEFAGERTPVRGVTILYFPVVEVPVVHVAIARKEITAKEPD